MNIDNIDPNLLSPNPWNTNSVDPEAEAKLETSVTKLGMFKPVVVRELEGGELQILGGEHRWRVAKRLHMTELPVFNLGRIDDNRAKKISLVDNARYGADDSLALADLLSELGSQEEIASFMPFAPGELDQLFANVSIDLDDLEIDGNDEDDPVLPPSDKVAATHQIMRFRVSIADAPYVSEVIEHICKSMGFKDEDEMTNVGDALVQLSKLYREAKSDEV